MLRGGDFKQGSLHCDGLGLRREETQEMPSKVLQQVYHGDD